MIEKSIRINNKCREKLTLTLSLGIISYNGVTATDRCLYIIETDNLKTRDMHACIYTLVLKIKSE